MRDAYSGRRLWPWVLLALVVSVLAIVIGGHWVWSTGAGRRLDAQVAQYKAAGEPIEVRDFVSSGLSDGENAAVDLRKAVASIDRMSETWKDFEQLQPQLPLTDREVNVIEAAVAENQAAFDGVDAAMRKPGIDWNITIKSPAITVLLPDLNQQRELANLIYHRALLAHQRGDDAVALRDLQRLEFLAQKLGETKQTFLVSHLVSCGIEMLMTRGVEQMSPRMKIGDGAGAAPRAQVKRLMEPLLDEQRHRASLRAGLLGERMFQLDTARCVADGTLNLASIGSNTAPARSGGGPLTVVIRPMALSDGLLMIRQTTAVIQAAQKASDWPQFKATAPPIPTKVVEKRVLHPLASVLLPAFDNSVKRTFSVITERRLAATALAIRMYQLDHGARPERLEDLTPEYLPSVPVDLMAADGAAIKYLPRAENPIVYSVGEDGVDQGGSEVPTIRSASPNRWQREDGVMHLSPQARDEEPATQATAPSSR